MPDTRRSDVAVFIDFENVYVSVRDKLDANPNFESIMERCEELGRVVIARAYADWYRYPRVTSALFANGIEPIYVPTYYYDKDRGRTGGAIKNSVDIHLCIDMMKTLFTNENIEKFVLVTGDRDFIPLVNSVRQRGKEVTVIGIGGAASSHLAQSADEFIFYEALVGKPSSTMVEDRPRARIAEKLRQAEYEPEIEPAPLPTRSSRDSRNGRERDRETREREPRETRETRETRPVPTPEPEPAPLEAIEADADVYALLVEAVQLARKRGYVGTLGSLKLLMKELMGGDFKESRYRDGNGRPFAKFKDFVAEAERRGKVQIFTSGTVNEVFLPGEDPYKLSQFAAELKEEPAPPPVREEPRPLAAPAGRRRRRRSRSQRAAEEALAGDLLFETPDGLDSGDVPGLEFSNEDLFEPILADTPESSDLAELPDLDDLGFFADEPIDFESDLLIDVPITPPLPYTDILLDDEADDDEAIELMPSDDTIPEAREEEFITDNPLLYEISELSSYGEPEPIVGADQTAEFDADDADDDLILADPPVPALDDLLPETVLAENPPEGLDLPVPEPATAEQAVEPVSADFPAEAQLAAEPAVFAEVTGEEPGEATTPVETLPAAEADSDGAASDEDADTSAMMQVHFSDEEWETFITMMRGFSKPISFQQIFNNLRELRSQGQLNRTNEELRSLAKQAINAGRLERSGRGNRVYYRLKSESEA